MKKAMLYIVFIVLLSGCVTTPDSISIQSTVESAVSTAIAPYEAKYEHFITRSPKG